MTVKIGYLRRRIFKYERSYRYERSLRTGVVPVGMHTLTCPSSRYNRYAGKSRLLENVSFSSTNYYAK